MIKTSLIVGGNGALGRSVVQQFKLADWKVFCLDLTENAQADVNILLNAKLNMQDQLANVLNQTINFDAIICVAGGFEVGTIKESNIFDLHDRMDRANLKSALLTAHIATHRLSNEGLLMFTGAASVYKGPVDFACAYYLSKAATHSLAKQMSLRKDLPQTSSVITLLPNILDTKANREAMPDANKSKWAPTDQVAELILIWANEKEKRPKNGQFAEINYEDGAVSFEIV